MSKRIPKCKMCGVEIVESLSEIEGATDWLCLECSGATLADFMDEEDEYSQVQRILNKLARELGE